METLVSAPIMYTLFIRAQEDSNHREPCALLAHSVLLRYLERPACTQLLKNVWQSPHDGGLPIRAGHAPTPRNALRSGRRIIQRVYRLTLEFRSLQTYREAVQNRQLLSNYLGARCVELAESLLVS